MGRWSDQFINDVFWWLRDFFFFWRCLSSPVQQRVLLLKKSKQSLCTPPSLCVQPVHFWRSFAGTAVGSLTIARVICGASQYKGGIERLQRDECGADCDVTGANFLSQLVDCENIFWSSVRWLIRSFIQIKWETLWHLQRCILTGTTDSVEALVKFSLHPCHNG